MGNWRKLDHYKKEMEECRPLSKDERHEIDETIKKIRNGKLKIANHEIEKLNHRLIKSCLRLAFREATKYVNKDNDLEDLIEAANEGVVMACSHYDPSHKMKFSSYASYWIRQYIFAELKSNTTIRLPVKDVSLRAKIDNYQDHRLSNKEIAKKLCISEKRFLQLSRLPCCKVSIDAKAANISNDETEGSLLDYISSGEISPLEKFVDKKYNNDIKVAVMKKLKGRDLKLISLLFGLNDGTAKTLRETAEVLGISKERVRQERNRILQKLKAAPEIRRLADL